MNPQNLMELIAALDEVLDEAQKQQVQALLPQELTKLHHGLGLIVRDRFLHPGEQYFGQGIRQAGVCADTFSGLICEIYWLHLHAIAPNPQQMEQLIQEWHWISFNTNITGSITHLFQGGPLKTLDLINGSRLNWDD